jgi:hypothetical protein
MVGAASLLVFVAMFNVYVGNAPNHAPSPHLCRRQSSLFMLGLCLWFLAISGLRMSLIAFRQGALMQQMDAAAEQEQQVVLAQFIMRPHMVLSWRHMHALTYVQHSFMNRPNGGDLLMCPGYPPQQAGDTHAPPEYHTLFADQAPPKYEDVQHEDRPPPPFTEADPLPPPPIHLPPSANSIV